MNASTAVMARRSRDPHLGNPALEEARRLDLYPTPPWATRALTRVVLPPGMLHGAHVWEPAAGMGHMSDVLAEEGCRVTAFDKRAWRDDIAEVAFLNVKEPAGPPDWIITNPPFNAAETFALKTRWMARIGVAFLCRLSFIEGQTRFRDLWRQMPPSLVAVFAERVPMTLGGWDPCATTATSYAWFVWNREALNLRRSSMDATWRMQLIPPGTRQALTLPGDERFAMRYLPGFRSRWVARGMPKLAP